MSFLLSFVGARSPRAVVPGPPPAGGTGPVPAAPIVTVTAGGVGQASITWELPPIKADGSTLPGGDILRCWVYEGTTSGQQRFDGSYVQRLSVTAPTVTRTITGLSVGTHYLTVSCESTYGEGEVSFEYPVTVT